MRPISYLGLSFAAMIGLAQVPPQGAPAGTGEILQILPRGVSASCSAKLWLIRGSARVAKLPSSDKQKNPRTDRM
jgi:hypothetical protein